MPQPPFAQSSGDYAAITANPPRWRRRLGSVLGLLLLAAAVAMVASQRGSVADAFDAIAQHGPARRARLLAIMLGSVALNIALTGVMFRLLLSRVSGGGNVGALEMQALIAGATLINYLPLRPGVLGRIAYHKTIHGIAVRDVITTMAQAAALSALAALFLSSAALLARRGAFSPWLLAAAPLPALVLAGAMLPRSARALAWSAAARLLDVLVAALRYHAAFALIGSPVDWTSAMAFACISVLATMVPLVSNGLGLREWAIGLLAPAIASHQMELGLTADLLNRAVELAMVTLAGVPATLWLARRVPAHDRISREAC